MADVFVITPPRVKYAAGVKPFTLDLVDDDDSGFLRTYWMSGHEFAANAYVRAPSVPGFAYQSSGGESGAIEPQWPRVLGGTVQDGSIIWTAVATSTNALDPISSVNWSQVNPPDGTLTIGSKTFTNESCTAVFSAGTQGNTYRIHVDVTTASGMVYPFEFDLEIS